MATGFGGAGTVAPETLGQPMTDMALDSRKFGHEVRIRQRAIAHARPQDQQILSLTFQVVANSVGRSAAFQDFLEVAHEMAPAHLTLAGIEPVVSAAAVSADYAGRRVPQQ